MKGEQPCWASSTSSRTQPVGGEDQWERKERDGGRAGEDGISMW